MLVAAFGVNACGAQEPPKQPATPQQFMFKGRLASVGFTNKVDPKRRVVTLLFNVDASWAMVPHDEELGTPMASVVTDWPQGDLSNLSAENYAQTINAMLQDGVRLGESYLVTTHWPAARGQELVAVEPATIESEEEFLATHKEYILNSRWYYDRIALESRVMRLRIVQREITGLAADRKSMESDPKVVERMTAHIESRIAAGESEREENIAAVSSTLDGWRQERRGMADALERQYCDLRIADAERTLADLKAFTFIAQP